MRNKFLGLAITLLFLIVIFSVNDWVFLGKALGENEPSFRLLTTSYNQMAAPGEEVIINSNIIKFGDTKRIDMSLEIEVQDPNGETISKSTETFAIETQVNLIKIIILEEDAATGVYEITSRLFYGNAEVAISREIFKVEKKTNGTGLNVLFLSAMFTLALLVIALIMSFPHMKRINFLRALRK